MDNIKLLFLDIDGVLNSNKYFQHPQYREECNALDLRDYYGEEVLELAPYLHMDPSAIKLLNSIIDQTGAYVILSSAWRRFNPILQINQWLQMRGATFDLLDQTPQFKTIVPRGHEVKSFLDSFKQSVSSFVIIDDLPHRDFKSFRKQFVQTDPNVGLTLQDVEKIINILNQNDDKHYDILPVL